MSSNRVSHFHCMDFIDMYEGASFNFIFFYQTREKIREPVQELVEWYKNWKKHV